MIENLARAIANLKIYIDTERKLIGPNNARRFHCILASPLLAMSAISNFYFFGGAEIGNIFMQRIFSGKFIFELKVSFFFHSFIYVYSFFSHL